MNGVRRTRLAGALCALAVVAAACSAGGGDAAGGGGGEGAAQTSLRAGGSPPRSSAAAGAYALPSGGGRGSSAARLPTIGPSVIKTATVGVAVEGVTRAVQEATQVAGRYGGFVASTTVAGGAGNVVLRVPAARFESALAALEDLGEVDRETVSGEDVGQEVIDLQARLRNWQSQEAVLLRLMDRARTVTDTIRVQGELSRVQLEIERLRGRLSYLEDQTDMATITATFTPAGATPSRPSTLARAWERAGEAALAVVSGVIVGAGFVLPLALLAGIALLVVRTLRPRAHAEP